MNACADFDQVRTAIASDLSAAMKARDRIRVDALRRTLNTLDNATGPAGATVATAGSASEGPRRLVSAAEMRQLMLAEAEECTSAATEYDRLDRPERAGTLRAEAEVICGCLRHLEPLQGAAGG